MFDKNTVFKNDSFGLQIKYKYDNEYKWNKLSTGVIKTDIFTNNLKMDIILNENILIDFIHILENKTLNKYY